MNMDHILSDLCFIRAELILLGTSIVALVYGLFINEQRGETKFIIFCGMLVAMIALILSKEGQTMLFSEVLIFNGMTLAFRILVLGSSVMCFCFMLGEKMRFEVPILMCISTASLMLMVSSNDLMTMYITMELSALAMYICVSSDKSSYFATEAGLKYFILSSVTSCIFLFGTSMVSGFTSSFSFDYIGSYTLASSDDSFLPLLFLFSGIMIMSAFLFKISAIPFHTWIVDVYQGAPFYVSLFIGTTSKIAICGLLVRALYSLFDNLNIEMQTILSVVSVLSMFIGSICAAMQESLRRMLAYSSISNIGFAIAAIATGSTNGIASGFVYTVIYSLFMFLPAFVLITLLATSKKEPSELTLSDLRELNISNPYQTALLTLIMLSTAGLPPFAGFFGKFFMLITIIAQDMQELSVLFMIGAALSTIYCIKIIKSTYFVDLDVKSVVPTLTVSRRFESVTITIICLANVVYWLYSSQSVSFFSMLFREFL